MSDDANQNVALACLAFALRDRLAWHRPEPLHHHGLVGQPEDRVVCDLAVGDEIHCGG